MNLTKKNNTIRSIAAPKCKTLEHFRKYAPQNNNQQKYEDVTLDNYHWLTDKSNPEVIEYLTQENNYTESIMAQTKELQAEIFQEIKARIQESDTTAPWQHDNYLYYFRTEAKQEYSIFCRKNISNNIEEILLDENILAEHHDFFNVGDIEVSPCHSMLAYTVDTSGDEDYELWIKDLNNNTLFETKINKISCELAWSADGKEIIFIKLDNSHRPYKVYYYNLEHKNYNLIFTEPDQRFELSIERTATDKYILINSQSKISAEVYYFSAHNINQAIQNKTFSVTSIKPRQQNCEYHVEHYTDTNNTDNTECFYILLNTEETPNYTLYRAYINNLDFKNWQLLIKHDLNTKLEHIECFLDYAVLYTKSTQSYGTPELSIINNYQFDNITKFDIEKIFNEQVYDIEPGNNVMFDNNDYQFHYESLNTPPSCYNINPKAKNTSDFNLKLIKADQVLNGHDKKNYVSERILVKINDVNIPVSLIYNKHKYQKDGLHPLLLYGYGSYGISIDPYFSYSRVSLLDRGIAFAVAHIRGGGELGEKWHHMGRLACKKNTFDDFINCAEYLIQHKYTNYSKLIIQGGSAGGLLIGNVINQRPELFGIAIAEVPFVDCLNTILNPDLPLTVSEYEEWGNPSESIETYEYMKSYSPYENVTQQYYPHLFINNSLNDYRVSYWEAAKWTAKLREFKLDNNVLLLKTLMNAGHHGASGRYEALHDVAYTYSFIIMCLNLAEL